MRQLDRKILRDLLQMRGQSVAIGLVIACGVATFVMSLSTLESLTLTRDTYFDRYRFAHVFASVKRAPMTLLPRIRAIPGVAQVEARILRDVTLDVEGLLEPAVGRLISIPEGDMPVVNSLHLRRGRYLHPGRPGEVLISEAFAEAHGLEPGDSISAVINEQWRDLKIVGIALSPEYVFEIKSGDALPDNKRFGVLWMGEEELAAAFDMEEAFNDLALRLMHGASQPEVILRLDQLLERYGGVGAHGRDEQLSARYLADEIRGLRGMGMVAPAIFLGVAAFLLNVVMNRVVSLQREQIAALKAFGYSNRGIGLHYLKLVLLITFGGVVLGTGMGIWLGSSLTSMYTHFYRFPLLFYHCDPALVVGAAGISAAAAVLGTVNSVRRAVKLPPAEAMRPEPPSRFRPTMIERIGLQRFLSQTTRMILRQLERRPFKAVLSTVGIAMGVAVLIMGRFMVDALDYLMEFQFFLAQRHDVAVTLVDATSEHARYELSRLPGVLRAETYRSVPVRLRFGPRSRRVGLVGLEPDRQLFRLMDADEILVSLPAEGLLLSEKLAELLGVVPGDVLTVEVLEQERPIRNIPVVKLIADFAGTNAFMRAAALHDIMQEAGTVSGGYLSVDSRKLDELYRQLKRTPRVAGVSVQKAALESFKNTVAENQLRMQTFMVIFACIITFGVVYNTARISLSERSRELATLRVIGFRRGEVSAILLGELAVLTIAAIPVGIGIGYGFAWLTVWAFESEFYRIPLVVTHSTTAFAAAVTMAASLVSGLIVRRRIDHLDLVSVLKSKE